MLVPPLPTSATMSWVPDTLANFTQALMVIAPSVAGRLVTPSCAYAVLLPLKVIPAQSSKLTAVGGEVVQVMPAVPSAPVLPLPETSCSQVPCPSSSFQYPIRLVSPGSSSRSPE